ncbi:unnamed protein product, partial [Symbiodinium microadriaticum]
EQMIYMWNVLTAIFCTQVLMVIGYCAALATFPDYWWTCTLCFGIPFSYIAIQNIYIDHDVMHGATFPVYEWQRFLTHPFADFFSLPWEEFVLEHNRHHASTVDLLIQGEFGWDPEEFHYALQQWAGPWGSNWYKYLLTVPFIPVIHFFGLNDTGSLFALEWWMHFPDEGAGGKCNKEFWSKWIPRRIKHNAFVLGLWACVWLLGTYPLGRPLSEGWRFMLTVSVFARIGYSAAWMFITNFTHSLPWNEFLAQDPGRTWPVLHNIMAMVLGGKHRWNEMLFHDAAWHYLGQSSEDRGPKDYVDTISQTGQYVGALEVYAAAHVLNIRVYIVHESGQVYLFNREGEGSPVVLYYSSSAKHYEWLEGDLEDQLQPRAQGGKPKCDGLRGGDTELGHMQLTPSKRHASSVGPPAMGPGFGGRAPCAISRCFTRVRHGLHIDPVRIQQTVASTDWRWHYQWTPCYQKVPFLLAKSIFVDGKHVVHRFRIRQKMSPEAYTATWEAFSITLRGLRGTRELGEARHPGAPSGAFCHCILMLLARLAPFRFGAAVSFTAPWVAFSITRRGLRGKRELGEARHPGPHSSAPPKPMRIWSVNMQSWYSHSASLLEEATQADVSIILAQELNIGPQSVRGAVTWAATKGWQLVALRILPKWNKQPTPRGCERWNPKALAARAFSYGYRRNATRGNQPAYTHTGDLTLQGGVVGKPVETERERTPTPPLPSASEWNQVVASGLVDGVWARWSHDAECYLVKAGVLSAHGGQRPLGSMPTVCHGGSGYGVGQPVRERQLRRLIRQIRECRIQDARAASAECLHSWWGQLLTNRRTSSATVLQQYREASGRAL